MDAVIADRNLDSSGGTLIIFPLHASATKSALIQANMRLTVEQSVASSADIAPTLYLRLVTGMAVTGRVRCRVRKY